MKRIGPMGSSQEIFIDQIIRSLRYKPQLHKNTLPGKPDFVFPRKNKVIFVNGCFWHGHKNCVRTTFPSTNKDFWKKKILGNIERDKKVNKQLKKLGWSYLVLWQCGINKSREEKLKGKIKSFLGG